MLLDLVLPDINGIEVLKEYKRNTNTYIIVISALESRDDMDKVFAHGADDYIQKGKFDEELLMAKIRNIIAKRNRSINDIIQAGYICLDTKNRIVLVKNKRIPISNIEYRILELFVNNPNRIFNYKNIIDEIWGENYPMEDNQVRWHINNIRRKIEDEPKHPKIILTEHGRGYILVLSK